MNEELLPQCVDDLTDPTHDIYPSSCFDMFVLSRSKFNFSAPSLLNALENRFLNASEEQKYAIAARVCAILSSWARCCLSKDFLVVTNGTNLYSCLMALIDKISKEKLQDPDLNMQQLTNRVKLALLRAKPKFIESETATRKKKKRRRRALSKSTKFHSLFEYSVTEIASQMSYEEARIFRRIHPKEFMDLAWQKDNRKELAPHIALLVERFNSTSFVVSMRICETRPLKERAQVLASFIALAQALYEMNNLNGLMEVLSGLNTNSVSRLKKTQNELDEKSKEQWKVLNEVMNVKQNYANYRELLQSTKGVVIPFLGVHLRDLVFTDEGNPDLVDGRVNIEKLEVGAQTLATIQRFQDIINANYHVFILDKDIQVQLAPFINPVPAEASEILYQLSVELEPLQVIHK